MDEALEPEILLDIVAPTPQQQKIIDIITRLMAGGFVLWLTGGELMNELNKMKKPKRALASLQ